MRRKSEGWEEEVGEEGFELVWGLLKLIDFLFDERRELE